VGGKHRSGFFNFAAPQLSPTQKLYEFYMHPKSVLYEIQVVLGRNKNGKVRFQPNFVAHLHA